MLTFISFIEHILKKLHILAKLTILLFIDNCSFFLQFWIIVVFLCHLMCDIKTKYTHTYFYLNKLILIHYISLIYVYIYIVIYLLLGMSKEKGELDMTILDSQKPAKYYTEENQYVLYDYLNTQLSVACETNGHASGYIYG